MHNEAVARLFDASGGKALEAPAQRRKELAEEELAVSALQPKLVIMDDNRGMSHCLLPGSIEAAASMQEYSSGLRLEKDSAGTVTPAGTSTSNRAWITLVLRDLPGEPGTGLRNVPFWR